jgi:hypothetical protein
MATFVRWMLCLAWMAGMGWSWQTGALSGLVAALLAAPALLLPRIRTARRRSGALQYVQMAKAPVAAP